MTHILKSGRGQALVSVFVFYILVDIFLFLLDFLFYPDESIFEVSLCKYIIGLMIGLIIVLTFLTVHYFGDIRSMFFWRRED